MKIGILIVFKGVVTIVEQNKRIIKYRLVTIISLDWFKYGTFFLILIFNFSALFNSGILLSGGASFNGTEKYELIMNNYITINSLYGGIISICLGAGLIGVDVKSKNIYVIFSAIKSRRNYYLLSILAGELIYIIIHTFITLNCILIMKAVSINFLWDELLQLYVGILLNATVYYVITSFCSVLIKGYKSIIIGILMYVYYYVYTFNTIPFVNGAIQFDIVSYKKYFGALFPMTNLLVKSVTDIQVYEYFLLAPLGINVSLYQVIYIIVFVILGTIAIDRKSY